MTTTHAKTEPLSRALALLGDLNGDDHAAIRALPLRLHQAAAGEDLTRQGKVVPECCILLEGLICRYKSLASGQRQILSLHYPGEIPDLHGIYLDRLDFGISALAKSLVAHVPHEALEALTSKRPAIAAALLRAALIDASISREWIAGIGRRTAAQRMAHLFCEMLVRMELAGVASGQRFHLPMNQSDLADALGLSVVHVNRTVQELRRAGLICLSGRTFEALDWPRLVVFADFDPDYLHMRRPLSVELA